MDRQRAIIKLFGFVLFLLLFAFFAFKVIQSAQRLSKEVSQNIPSYMKMEDIDDDNQHFQSVPVPIILRP